MKKNLRKLSLSRETLRTLESPALERIAGGAKPPAQTTTCTSDCTSSPILACDYTLSCPELCHFTTAVVV
jgi:hypothetical protein